MKDSAMKLLCGGDLHLGRHPTRIPENCDGPQFSPGEIWSAMVDYAVQAGVDAVVVTGDVIDVEDRYIEAYGAFLRGVRRLEDADIPLLAVGGNHDVDTLPRLINDAAADNVRFLGLNGVWERYELVKDDSSVFLDGWSYPNSRVHESPLKNYHLEPISNRPSIGLLHADLDAAESHYCPVPRSELIGSQHDAWVLGHIHRPQIVNESAPLILYPGSPQPLDPGEKGEHGAWLLEVSRSGAVKARQIPLANVRYDEVEVNVADAQDVKDVVRTVEENLENYVKRRLPDKDVELFLSRLQLTGRSRIHSELWKKFGDLRNLESVFDGVEVRVENIENFTRPALNFDALVLDKGPVARLAELFMQLDENPDDCPADLMQMSVDIMREAYHAGAYSPLKSEGRMGRPSQREACEHLKRQVMLLLDTLVKQKEGKE